jgi:DNA-binding PadR family transcriptional regulator
VKASEMIASLRLRRAELSQRVLEVLDWGPRTLPQLLDQIHCESNGTLRIDEKDLVPVLSLLIEDGVIETYLGKSEFGAPELGARTHYVLRVKP